MLSVPPHFGWLISSFRHTVLLPGTGAPRIARSYVQVKRAQRLQRRCSAAKGESKFKDIQSKGATGIVQALGGREKRGHNRRRSPTLCHRRSLLNPFSVPDVCER